MPDGSATAWLRHGVRGLLWPALALALLLGFNAAFTPGFCRFEVHEGHLYGSLIDVLKQGAPVMLVGLGMTLVIATRGVDLSVGAVTAIAGSLAATLLTQHHTGLAPMIAVTLTLSLALGAWNGLLVAVAGIQPIVATLILMVAGRGAAQLLSAGQIITVEDPGFSFIAGGFFLGLPFPATLVVVTALLTAALTHWTAIGLSVEAVGGNETASRYAGVPVARTKLFVYAFCGLCAGVAGLIKAADIKAADANNAGLYLELDAILAVVLGGTSLDGGRFSLAGSLLGALIIQTLNTTILTRGVHVEYTLIVKALVVLAVCLLQSERFRAALTRRTVDG